MYKLLKIDNKVVSNIVFRVDNSVYIPFDQANTDYQAFKKEVLAGAELQDADGDLMTPTEAKAYVATLP